MTSNDEDENNPFLFKATTSEQDVVPNQQVFGSGYWFFNFAIIGLILVAFLFAVLLPEPNPIPIIVFLFIAACFTTYRSWLYSSRMTELAKRGWPLPPHNDPTIYYVKSFFLALFATLASCIAFVAICLPLGFVLMSGPYGSNTGFGLIIVLFGICAVIGLGIGTLIMRCWLPSLDRMLPNESIAMEHVIEPEQPNQHE